MDELTFTLLRIVISVTAALITVYLIPYLKSQTNTKQMDELIGMINVAVKAAEQTVKGGKMKKAEVITFMSEWMNSRGISITDDQLDKLIESAVYSMNNATTEVVVAAKTDPVEASDDDDLK